MGFIIGTTTLDTVSGTQTTILELQSNDLGYIVILLLILVGLLSIDLIRRLFIRR